MKRRDVIKGLSLLPLAGVYGSALAQGATTASTSKTGVLGALASANQTGAEASAEVFRAIGVEPIINCRGTFTIIGGSVELPEVKAAVHAAADNFVQYDELAAGVGQHLAKITGAEWGMVSSGCAAGMKHVTVACLTGGNPEKLIRLPNVAGFEKTEVIIPRYARNVYDHAIRNTGATIITVETAEELKNAISNRTAMIYLMSGGQSEEGPLSTRAIAAIAKPHNVPILVDAAAEDLTVPNVHLADGADVVAYSGGKVMCGPQGAGLLLGKKSILQAAWQASAPHHGIGRNDKVGREETMGMVAAVEAWLERDHKAVWQKWLSWLDTINKRVSTIPGIKTEVREPNRLSNHSPSLSITWDPNALHVTGDEIVDEMVSARPRIAVGGSRGENGLTGVSITAFQMQDGNDKIVADRLYEVLSQKRTPKSTTPVAAAHDVTGRWEVNIKFANSESVHNFYIEQQDNWVTGVHQGDFYTRDMVGSVEGNEVKFQSAYRAPGDNLVFSFSGTLSGNDGDQMTGRVHMGEYLECTFAAKKVEYTTENRRSIKIPVGPPLST